METPRHAKANDQAKTFPAASRLERLIPPQARARFEKVLRKGLLDLDSVGYDNTGFFDEIPLYSRYKHVEFLEQYGDVNLLLLELALDYLEQVRSGVHLSRTRRFLAITITRYEDDYIVPAIFVCNGEVRNRLKVLHLTPPSAGLGKDIEKLVRKTKLDALFTVLEDRETVPEEVRVFVSYKSPPPGLVSLETFAAGAAA
jgi:hypothetical protein